VGLRRKLPCRERWPAFVNRMMQRFRILPLLILVAVAMVTLKVGTIWQELAGLNASVDARSAAAQEGAAAKSEAANAPEKTAETPGKAPGSGEGEGGAVPEIPTAAPPMTEQTIDPRELSQSEVRLLQALAERRKALDAREYSLNQREALLKAAEQRILDRQTEFVKVRDEVKQLLGFLDEQEAKKIKDLVKLYENMKPRDAARILNDLEIGVLLSVVQRMNVRRLAPILAAMDPDKARAVTRALAKREKDGKDAVSRMKESIAERK
jgi:flagellar motility protein MotE (MotC chaperone)